VRKPAPANRIDAPGVAFGAAPMCSIDCTGVVSPAPFAATTGHLMPTMPKRFKRWRMRLRRLLQQGEQARVAHLHDIETGPRQRLLGGEQIELRGQALGRLHRLHTGRRPDRLLARLRSNETRIDASCAVHPGRRMAAR
jgi:hypothetical protein